MIVHYDNNSVKVMMMKRFLCTFLHASKLPCAQAVQAAGAGRVKHVNLLPNAFVHVITAHLE